MNKSNLTIRQENYNDYNAVETLIEAAFRNETYSDKQEHHLVNRLRRSAAFVPELSLVAEADGKVLGHILLTRILIGEHNKSLALAPLSVLPEYQKQGIGSRLINEAHRIAYQLGYTSVVVLGHPEYYPRFGFKNLSDFGIRLPFDGLPDNVCMVIELAPHALDNVKGVVKYAPEFND